MDANVVVGREASLHRNGGSALQKEVVHKQPVFGNSGGCLRNQRFKHKSTNDFIADYLRDVPIKETLNAKNSGLASISGSTKLVTGTVLKEHNGPLIGEMLAKGKTISLQSSSFESVGAVTDLRGGSLAGSSQLSG
ncbi:hypothetical protein AMTR_s00015p00225640 [Amborella trichopoda]|uniref:Uncharacterized protein n=1 Tax=Amborella trichopoda TaxID=13333 RepID=W1PNZ4_AMBTC|nr:hypothetical protein AMTR_s00015p00225640 [Amborella trichopoda]